MEGQYTFVEVEMQKHQGIYLFLIYIYNVD